MSSNAQRKSSSNTRSFTKGITTLRSAKTRIFAFLTLMILTAVFSASALTANNDQAAAQQSGSYTAKILSFFGFNSNAQPATGDMSAIQPDPEATPPEGLTRPFIGVKGDFDANAPDGSACTAPPNGKAAWYPDNDGAVFFPLDFAGAPYSNFNTGGAGFDAGYVGGGGTDFNGTTEFYAVSPVTPELTLAGGTGISVEVWMNPDQVATQDPIVEWGNAGDIGAHFFHSVGAGGNLFVNLAEADGTEHSFLTAGGILTAGVFQHVAFTYESSTGNARIYLNGVAQNITPGPGSVAVNLTTVSVGAITPETTLPFNYGRRPFAPAEFFSGSMDELGVYSRPLTAAEVLSIDAADTSGQCINSIGFDSATSATVETTGEPLNVINYTVNRTGATSQPASILVNSAPGTAMGDAGSGCANPGSDFQNVPTNSVINFAANQTTANFAVTICNDTFPESSETYTVTLSSPQGANTGTSAAPTITTNTTTITDDDFATVTVSAPASVLEDGLTNLVYTFTRTGSTVAPLTVSFTVGGTGCSLAPCSDTNPVDYTVTGAATFVGTDGTTPGSGTIIIPAGMASASLTVDPTADTIVEPDETVIITPLNGVPAAGTPITGTILNDDTNLTCVLGPPTSVNEDGAANLNYVCTRTGVTATAASVPFTLSGTATFTTDYTISGDVSAVTAAGGTLNFAAGSSTATIIADPVTDAMTEADETVIVTFMNGATFTVNPNPTTLPGTISNDDFDVTIAVAPASVSESGGAPLAFTFTRNGVNAAAITVNFSLGLGGNNAEFPADFNFACPGTTCTFNQFGGTIVIPAGGASNTAVLNITPINDGLTEPDETVILAILAGVGYNIGTPSVATGTITNDDNAVSVTVSPSSVGESSGSTLVYTFSRNGNTTQALTINFSVGGTATFATDYTANSPMGSQPATFTATTGTVTFAIGSTTAIVNVTPVADTDVEVGGETVILTVVPPLSGQNYTVGAPSSATGAITDDDTSVSIAVGRSEAPFAGTTVNENGTANLIFTITRTGVTTGALTVNYTISGTASNGGDFAAIGTSVVIPAGQASATVTVDPIGDGIVEDDETVTLTLAPGAGYTVGTPSSATGTILNDDTTFTIVANSPTTEGDNPSVPTTATFTVTRSGPNSVAGQVDVSTIPGSGTATANAPNTVCQPGSDYITDGTTLFFPAGGTTSLTFTVLICGDLAFELTETFDAQLTNPIGGTLGVPATATMTILDNDAMPVLTVGDVTVNENAGTVTLTVTQRNRATGTPLATGTNTTFTFTTAGVTATPNVDFSSTTGTGTITAGSTSTTITIPIIDDNLDEPNETFTVTITSATNASITVIEADPVAVVTITDNEDVTQISISDVAQVEGNANPDPTITSTSSFNFRITRTGDAQADQVVCFDTIDGDFASVNANPNPATGGDAPGPGIDYRRILAGPSNCVTFTQGGPSVITVPVIVYGDDMFEFDESFTVRLLSASNAAVIVDANGLGTILNDDLAAVFNVASGLTAPNSILETDLPTPTQNYPFVITRNTSAVASSVQYTTSNGTSATSATGGPAIPGCVAGNGVDYITTSGTANFPVGVTSVTINVPICGDLLDENNETFTFTISNATLATIGTASATGTIIDNDGAPIISVSDVTACEPDSGTTAFVFTITRTGPSNLTSTVNVSTVDGSATVAGGDYVAIVNQPVIFAPGETTRTVTVTVNGDVVFETDETFTLQVIAGSPDVVIAQVGGADPVGLGTIQNDCDVNTGDGGDAAPTFAVDNVTRAEGNPDQGTTTEFRFRITRTGLTQLPSTITFSTGSDSDTSTVNAIGGAVCDGTVDYIAQTNGTISFTPGGVNFRDVIVLVCTDTLNEPNETFVLNLTNATLGTIPADGRQGLGTISNDDGLNFTVDNVEGNEGNTGTTNFVFRINRNGTSALTTTVTYTLVAGTATGPGPCNGTNDFSAGTPATAVFAPGTSFVDITVPVCGDTTPEPNENFTLVLNSATIGTVTATAGIGSILNDDGPITAPVGIEGDVVDAAAGPAGDGVVLANDVNVTRQFALGNLTAVTSPNQFQRGDTSPRATFGDGRIDASDVTQTRRYNLGLDPVTPAAGPTAPVVVAPIAESGRLSPEVIGRTIRAVSVGVPLGATTVTVSYELEAQGDEVNVAFTTNFNSTVFSNPVVALGSGVPAGATLFTNVSQPGRVGVIIDSTQLNPYAQGPRQILTITFTIAPNTPTSTFPVTFSSSPVFQSVSNVFGVNLPTAYEPGNIAVGSTAAGVTVSGRVTTPSGQGLRNATVFITDAEGNRRTVRTSSFGVYTFEEVEAGGSYVVGVTSKRYRFGSRVVNISDNLADVNFVGQE